MESGIYNVVVFKENNIRTESEHIQKLLDIGEIIQFSTYPEDFILINETVYDQINNQPEILSNFDVHTKNPIGDYRDMIHKNEICRSKLYYQYIPNSIDEFNKDIMGQKWGFFYSCVFDFDDPIYFNKLEEIGNKYWFDSKINRMYIGGFYTNDRTLFNITHQFIKCDILYFEWDIKLCP